MKKICIILLICVCFLITGCSSIGEVGLIQNPEGSVIEYYHIPFPETKLLNAGINKTELLLIKNNINIYAKEVLQSYYNNFKKYVENDERLTQEQKIFITYGVKIYSSLDENRIEEIWWGDLEVVDSLQFQIYYVNTDCYLYFKNANELIKENKETITTSNFFTTTVKTVKDPVFDKVVEESVTLGKRLVEIGQNQFTKVIGNLRWQAVKLQLNFDTYANMFNYCYYSPTPRLHSNAHTVQKISNGFYAHVWTIDANNASSENPIKIEYWLVSANKVNWYITALIVSVVIIGSVIIISKKKKTAVK